jgi:hypothetical protein
MSNQRLIAALGQLEKVETNENEAVVALRFVNRMLRDKGLSWSDVGEMIEASSSKVQAPSFSDAFNQAFMQSDGPLSSFFSKKPEPQPRPQAHRIHNRILQGREIPKKIFGVVKIIEEREIRTGLMLVVTVEGSGETYTPLVVFSKDIVEKIKSSDGSKPYSMTVIQSQDERHSPKIVRMSDFS